jgi:hypothetical protein
MFGAVACCSVKLNTCSFVSRWWDQILCRKFCICPRIIFSDWIITSIATRISCWISVGFKLIHNTSKETCYCLHSLHCCGAILQLLCWRFSVVTLAGGDVTWVSCRKASCMRQNADVMHGIPTSHSTEPSTRGIACRVENLSMVLICNVSVLTPEYWSILPPRSEGSEKMQISDSS